MQIKRTRILKKIKKKVVFMFLGGKSFLHI